MRVVMVSDDTKKKNPNKPQIHIKNTLLKILKTLSDVYAYIIGGWKNERK